VIADQKTLVTRAGLVRGVDLPVELGVLIDASSSQRSKDLIGVLNAAKQFVGEIVSSPQDRVFFLTFDATQHATEWLKGEQLQGTTVPVNIGGATALYDALDMAGKERTGPRDWQKPLTI
jgi:hypothetical protein